jgi:hypothetical protein
MNEKDQKRLISRRIAAEYLRKLFAEWTAQLTAGTAEIWSKVEHRFALKTEAEGAIPQEPTLPHPTMQQSMQRQPMQQQQAKQSPTKKTALD